MQPVPIPPMLCLSVDRLPAGPGWDYQVKLDSYRAQAVRDEGGARLFSRNGNELTHRFRRICKELLAALPNDSIVDGEIVPLDKEGRPNFSLLQNAASSGAPIVFFAFDLLRRGAEDLTGKPLSERRALLSKSIRTSDAVQLSESFDLPAKRMIQMVRDHGLEGIVAKRLSSLYEPGKRSGAWVKFRVEFSQEFVIAGYTPGTNGFDAVLLGFYRGENLHFCASVRAGFVPASRRILFALLEPLIMSACPFVNLPESSAGRWGQGITAAKMEKCVWLKPKVVAQFKFLEWTPADHLRHASFVGVREDKTAKDVMKEG